MKIENRGELPSLHEGQAPRKSAGWKSVRNTALAAAVFGAVIGSQTDSNNAANSLVMTVVGGTLGLVLGLFVALCKKCEDAHSDLSARKFKPID